ncbi:MAG: HAD-IIA family hydrolase [Solirubrobacteraceae bacterium]
MSLSPLLARYDHVLLDLDGCVWVDQTLTPHVREALAELRGAGRTIAFVTNNSRLAPEEYVRKLWALGLQASLVEIVTVGSAVQYELANRRRGTPTYVIGADAVFRHVTDAGMRVVNGTDREAEAEIVVIAGHDAFDFAQLRVATQAVLAGAEMIAAGRDRIFPGPDGMWPGTGAIVAALEYATQKQAHSVGKPDPLIFRTALDRLGSGRALMVGDRLDSDLGGAAAAGIDAAIVLTGVTTRRQAEAAEDPAPVAIAENLYALVTA